MKGKVQIGYLKRVGMIEIDTWKWNRLHASLFKLCNVC